MQTDVKASAPLTSSGTITDQQTRSLQRVRVKGIYIVPGASAGSVTLKDGGSTGDTAIVINTVASATQPTYIWFPDQGILFEQGVYAALANVGSTFVFYG